MPLTDRTIAVTGATGFLGSHLVEQLASRGARVRGVVRTPSKGDWMRSERVDFTHGDLHEPDTLARAFEGVDAVVANAALSPGRRAVPDDDAFLRANRDGTRHTLEAAARAGVRRVVLVSTVAVYASRPFTRIAEDHPQVDPEDRGFKLAHLVTDPRYARTKAAAEQLAWQLADDLGLELTALRPGPIYGPRDRKATTDYARKANARLRFAPTVRVPHVHAADVASAAAAALHTEASIGRAYNLAGEPVSPFRVLRAWKRHQGHGAVVVPVPIPAWIDFDDTAARRDLGFQPRSIEEGLEDTVAWWREREG